MLLGKICSDNGCSYCCRETQMPITRDEAMHISTTTGLEIDAFTRDFKETKGILQLKNDAVTKTCVFLMTDSDSKYAQGICKIYEDRPIGCRLYPAILDQNDELWIDVDCPHHSEFGSPQVELLQLLLELDAKIQVETKNN